MTQTYDVTNSADSGAGSLREAISLANANPGKDDIFIGADVELSSSIDITDSVDIGTNFGAKILQTGADRIFNIDDGRAEENIDVSLYRLTLTGGNSDSVGGAILSQEDLTITDSQISENISLYKGGGIYQAGGSIYIERSQILANEAATAEDNELSAGGGIYLLNSLYDFQGSIFRDNESVVGEGVYVLNSTGQLASNNELDDSLFTVSIPAAPDAALSLEKVDSPANQNFEAQNLDNLKSYLSFGSDYSLPISVLNIMNLNASVTDLNAPSLEKELVLGSEAENDPMTTACCPDV